MKSAWKQIKLALTCAAVASSFSPFHANAQTKTASPTAEEARKFIEGAEQQLFELGTKSSRASWVEENFITDDTEQIAANANEALNTAATKFAKQAHRFDTVELPPDLAR